MGVFFLDFMLFRNISSLLFYTYNPKDRDYKGALEFLNSNIRLLRKNKTDEVLRNFNISDSHKKHFSNKDITELLSTMIISGFDSNWKKTRNIDNHLFKGNFRKNDSINNPEVRSVIKKGLDLMKACKDPFHDVTHIIRCVRFARYLYDNEYYDLDWGTIAAAVVWHDISRVTDLGFFHRNNLKTLRHVPFLQDLNIIENNLTDVGKSTLLMKNNLTDHGLDKEFIKKVASTISGSDNMKILKNFFGGTIKNRHRQIMYDVDTIDLFTLGRWESANRNVMYKKQGDKNSLNRELLLGFIFGIPNAYYKTYSNTTKAICKLSIAVNLGYGKMFYPTDHRYVYDSARRTGLIN